MPAKNPLQMQRTGVLLVTAVTVLSNAN